MLVHKIVQSVPETLGCKYFIRYSLMLIVINRATILLTCMQSIPTQFVRRLNKHKANKRFCTVFASQAPIKELIYWETGWPLAEHEEVVTLSHFSCISAEWFCSRKLFNGYVVIIALAVVVWYPYPHSNSTYWSSIVRLDCFMKRIMKGAMSNKIILSYIWCLANYWWWLQVWSSMVTEPHL